MKVFLKSYGCSTNLADGAILMGCLARAGHELVDSVVSADIVILNTCAVKGPTEDRMVEACRKTSSDKKLIVAGCLPMVDFQRLQRDVSFNGAVGPAAGERISEVVKRVSNGETVVAIEKKPGGPPRLNLPRVQRSLVTSVVPVSYGCLGSCAYCCVVFARGRLRSCTTQDVVERVERDLALGFREFWITSQDTGCYGRDLGDNLAVLLRALCAVEGNFRVRVGMMNVNNVLDFLDELVDSFRDARIFKFIHLPFQSGDDDVLQRMRRFYRVIDFKTVVETFRAKFPDVSLATDLICGFPGESEEAFQQTLQLLREVRPDVVNVSRFFPRPGTAAAQMRKDFVSPTEKKRRSVEAGTLAKDIAFENNRRWIGWTGEVLVDEVGKVPGSWVGRNFVYKPVVIKSSSNLIGRLVAVRVSKAFSTYLEAEVM